MAGQPPPSPALPWAWVIEALANFKEVDANTLIDVFNRSTKISSNVGSNAWEIASFRTLERLFDQETRPIKSGFLDSDSRVSFDVSERCEDVLRRILGEMRGPKIWDESEKSKWDAQPFIAYKRSCLVKSDLQEGTLVEERLSNLTSLKQRITSIHLNQSRTRICDVNGAMFDNQRQSPWIDDKVSQDTSNEGNGKGKCFDDVKLEGERSERTGTLKGEDGEDVEHGSESQPSSDDDWYQKEMNDIAAKKQVFFSSNCKDREPATHRKEASRCMKCSKGGQLLVCSSDACSFVFHDSCLVSTLSFGSDLVGEFYCPFCRYSQSISDYWVVKRKASLARNDLASFNRSTLKDRPKNSHKRLCLSELNATSEDKVVDEKNDISNENESSETSGTEGCNEGSSEQSDCTDHSIRLRKQLKPCTYLHVPQRRRVPVPWTQLEEETLKKWVEKFSGDCSIHERGVPWRKILELGACEFQKSRKPGDLKDKWRNMEKVSTNPT